MIKNELQYKLTKSSAENFEKRLHWLRENPGAQDQLDPILAKAEEDGLQSMIDELREEIQEYERTKQGDVDMTSLTSVHMVPSTLIRARIARGLSQRQLAQLVGLKEQQIQRYESNDYSNVDLGRVQEIARALTGDASTGTAQR
jgi:DNA-binding XRE family transcriptional regulator